MRNCPGLRDTTVLYKFSSFFSILLCNFFFLLEALLTFLWTRIVYLFLYDETTVACERFWTLGNFTSGFLIVLYLLPLALQDM